MPSLSHFFGILIISIMKKVESTTSRIFTHDMLEIELYMILKEICLRANYRSSRQNCISLGFDCSR